jgi:hypothetical protein
MVPGILVALKTRVRGGIEYQRTALDEAEDGTVKKWETTRYMEDPAERERANELRSKAARSVSKLCVRTTFGLLCRIDREDELDEAVVAMRAMVTEFNRTAEHCFVSASVIKGRIADNDEEAIRAIIDEAQEVLEAMDGALAEAAKNADEDAVKAVRKAADRAKALKGMMTPESASRIDNALEAARATARVIVKRGEDLGDRVATALVNAERDQFDKARFAFLDMAEVTLNSLPGVNLQRVAGLEVASKVKGGG